MAFNQKIANTVRELIAEAGEENVEEKKMFGGLCFMVNDKICVAIKKDKILVRLDPELYDEAMEQEGCTPMAHSGKTMKGYLFVSDEFLPSKKEIAHWVKLALDFNPVAKSSKNK